jgi:hypothetical protein
VDLGAGDDTLDVRYGGIDLWDSQWDTIRLGHRNDRLIGFAANREYDYGESLQGERARVKGGKGQDTLVLPEGVYTVTDDRVSTADAHLIVSGFNILEGINGGRFSYGPGLLTVDENGIASFSSGL